MENNIACCYLTHNHPHVVEEILNIIQEYYNKNGIDIYFYDSSTNEDTKEIIDKMILSGADNLYYIRIDESIGGDGKIYKILRQYGLKKKYDYIWPNKDRSYVLEQAAEVMHRESQKNYACIFNDCFMPLISDRRQYKKVYSREEFFCEFGWLVTSWDTVLISTKEILDSIDWSSFEKKYSLGSGNNFNQIITVFAGLDMIDNPEIRVLSGNETGIRNSTQVGSGITKYISKVWGVNWPKAIEKLPDRYNKYKKKVIKDMTSKHWIFGSLNNLIYWKSQGYLEKDNWNEIRDNWELLSDIPKESVEALLDDNYDKMLKLTFEAFNKALENEQYDKAYDMITGNEYWSILIGSSQYWILKACFDVYLQEIRIGKDVGIMYQIYNYKDLIKKYNIMKFYARRLEYEIDSISNLNMYEYFQYNHISSLFWGMIINIECVDIDKVILRWEEDFSNGGDQL